MAKIWHSCFFYHNLKLNFDSRLYNIDIQGNQKFAQFLFKKLKIEVERKVKDRFLETSIFDAPGNINSDKIAQNRGSGS